MQIPEQICLECGFVESQAVIYSPRALHHIVAGLLSVCPGCAAVNVVDDDLKLAKPPQYYLDALERLGNGAWEFTMLLRQSILDRIAEESLKPN